MLKELNEFKRANFFKGLMAGSEFWNDIQDYHLQKEHFYNRIFHGYGIVPGVMEELRISTVNNKGYIKIIIGPGFVIDRLGRALFLYKPEAKMVDYKLFSLPATVYITVHYNETDDDYFQNEENPDYHGYRKRLESAQVEISSKVPDNIEYIELGRIYLEENENGEIKEIIEPVDPTNPQPNNIDTRFVVWAETANSSLSPYIKNYLIDLLDKTKNAAQITNETVHLSGLRELQIVSLNAKMLVQCGNVSFTDIINILSPLHEINNNVIQEMLDFERNEGKRPFSSKESFNNFRTNVAEMGEIIKYYDHKLETLNKLVTTHHKTLNALKNIIITRKISFSDIAFISFEMPKILVVDDIRYTLVDFLDFTDFETEKRNNVTVTNEKDYTTSNQSFFYPDGVEVKDNVKRYLGGEVSFNIFNLIKNKELVMIRRTDIFHGDYKINVLLNDEYIKDLIVDGYDTKNRWRNLFITINEELIDETSKKITFRNNEAGRDNFGKIWIYQKI